MTLERFTAQIENILETEVIKLLPGTWNEDLLTYNFLIRLTRELSTTQIEDQRGTLNVRINAFKQSGALAETKFGDIAVIVRINYPDGEILEGVGFLEAKKRKMDSTRYDTVKVRQLKTINKNAPRARLLLYDFEPITGFINTYFEEEFHYRRDVEILRLRPTTFSVAVPVNLVLAVGHYDTKLYKFGLPFSHQLTFRYMNGHDLEFDKSILDATKGFADRQRLSNYIIAITIGPGKNDNTPEIKINSDYWENLK
jgi:hypothetical protein